MISVDDGIRPNTNLTNLAKLKPAFKSDGTTTAGTSLYYRKLFFLLKKVESNAVFMNFLGTASQVSDGAAAVLLMKRSVAMQKGLPILGVFRSVISFFYEWEFLHESLEYIPQKRLF